MVKLLCEKDEMNKPIQIRKLAEIVTKDTAFASLAEITSVRKPYGLSTDVIKTDDAVIYTKYHIDKIYKTKQNYNDITIYAKSGLSLYVPFDYKFPRKSSMFNKYKVFIPYAWGNMDGKCGLGGAFSDIIIGSPNEACTETYLESGPFETFDLAQKHSKYLMSKFCRALLYMNKFSQHSTSAWCAIPQQDYHEDWWSLSIAEIDEHLFGKYKIPEDIRIFIKNNIQTRTANNIVNFKN